jgi:hypothetical protein
LLGHDSVMFLFLYGEDIRERERERERAGKVALKVSFSSSLGKMMNNSQMMCCLTLFFTWH